MKALESGRYELSTPLTVSEQAIRQINDYLFKNFFYSSSWARPELYEKAYNLFDNIMNDIYLLDRAWITKRGTFSKRLSRILKKHHKKIDNKIISQCGQIARSSCQTFADSVMLYIKRQVDWSDGYYGDAGSCFFWCREVAPQVIFEHGGYALTLHTIENDPLGRAWVVPYEDNYVIFNSYARSGYSVECTTFARLLMDLLEVTYYRKIQLTNRGTTDGIIWINSNYGFIVGNNCQDIQQIDLDIKCICEECGYDFTSEGESYLKEGSVLCEECGNGDRYRCNNCGERVSEDNSYCVHDERYCEECFYDMYSYCEQCGEYESNEGGMYIENYGFVCEYCFQHYWSTCEQCGELVHNDDVIYSGNSAPYCEDCHHDKYTRCDHCDCEINREEYYEENNYGNPICKDCYDRYFFTCEECGDLHPVRSKGLNLHIHNGQSLCTDCYRETFVFKTFEKVA
jgi:hypothetical protein